MSDERTKALEEAIAVVELHRGRHEIDSRLGHDYCDEDQERDGRVCKEAINVILKDLRALASAPAPAQDVARLVETLEKIAKQKLGGEMHPEEDENADYEGAYHHIVGLARQALASFQDKA